MMIDLVWMELKVDLYVVNGSTTSDFVFHF